MSEMDERGLWRSAARPDDDCCEMLACILDKLARIGYDTANETHRNGDLLARIDASLAQLLEITRAVHPAEALAADRIARLEARLDACCPPEKPDPTYVYEPCVPRRTHGSTGWSVKSRGVVAPVEVGRIRPWKMQPRPTNPSDKALPSVGVGPFVGAAVPSRQTAAPLDFRSGGGTTPGGQTPVSFRTFTSGDTSESWWPPDSSGAKSGDVVLMSGNLWLRLSLDGGKTFTDLDWTKLFSADATYGGYGCDQVVLYVPEIDCFVLYVQAFRGTGTLENRNVVKIALASPADLRSAKGGAEAWRRQWDFTSADFGLAAWMDFPAMTHDSRYLYVNTNTFAKDAGAKKDSFKGKLFFELPLDELKAGGSVSYQYAVVPNSCGSPAQNIDGENYWAGHGSDGEIRIWSSRGDSDRYFWRDRKLRSNWPIPASNNIMSAAPDSTDWISTDPRIVGATRVGNEVWFAWSAASGQPSSGGFTFPQAHVQVAKVDVSRDYDVVDQLQIWNPDYAFAYPSLTTNSDGEVGISCGWGGGPDYGSHVVGILGDFVLWYGEASDRTSQYGDDTNPTRFGDYLNVRLAYPDTRFFSAFGYAVHTSTDADKEAANYLYVEFGRETHPLPGPR